MLRAPALLFVLMVVSGVAAFNVWAADGVVLTYRGANKWLAPNDNAPMRPLLDAAAKGQDKFEARLPATQRDLAAARLEILRDLLSAKNPHGVLIEEVEGAAAAPNTIWIK